MYELFHFWQSFSKTGTSKCILKGTPSTYLSTVSIDALTVVSNANHVYLKRFTLSDPRARDAGCNTRMHVTHTTAALNKERTICSICDNHACFEIVPMDENMVKVV
jgi:hypothetical protein